METEWVLLSGAAFVIASTGAYLTWRRFRTPRFHAKAHHDSGRHLGAFRLVISNRNRKSLRVERVRIAHSPDLVVYEGGDISEKSTRSITSPAKQPVLATFGIWQTIDGVQPNTAMPATIERDSLIAVRAGASGKRRETTLRLAIDWRYPVYGGQPKTAKMSVRVPIGCEE